MRWKIFQWMKFLFRHSSNSKKLSRQKFQKEPRVCIHCSFRKQKCRLKSTTTKECRHFGQSEQCKSSILFPIQSQKSPDSGFFTCDPPKKCIMPSFRERHKGIIGRGHALRLRLHWPFWHDIAHASFYQITAYLEFFLTNGLVDDALPVNISKAPPETRLVGVSYISNCMVFLMRWLGTLSFGFTMIVWLSEGPNGGKLSRIENWSLMWLRLRRALLGLLLEISQAVLT